MIIAVAIGISLSGWGLEIILDSLARLTGFQARAGQPKASVTGVEGLLGEAAEALSDFSPSDGEGRVRCQGEIWKAISKDPRFCPKRGERLKVVEVNGLKLTVSPLDQP